MNIVYRVFEDRAQEVNLYFKALEKLYETQRTFDEKYIFHNEHFLTVLKANALLMIYNLVESTVSGGVNKIYEEFKDAGLKYNDASTEIKNVWFSYKFNQAYNRNAHYDSYEKKALDIISCIISGEIIELGGGATSIKGNLDAKQIRQICEKHGIDVTYDEKCRGGIALADVKNKRNELAHGTISFAECGRDYSLLDLQRIKEETIIFLKGFLDGMSNYYNKKDYLCS